MVRSINKMNMKFSYRYMSVFLIFALSGFIFFTLKSPSSDGTENEENKPTHPRKSEVWSKMMYGDTVSFNTKLAAKRRFNSKLRSQSQSCLLYTSPSPRD